MITKLDSQYLIVSRKANVTYVRAEQIIDDQLSR
jgi:hypothetical protein